MKMAFWRHGFFCLRSLLGASLIVVSFQNCTGFKEAALPDNAGSLQAPGALPTPGPTATPTPAPPTPTPTSTPSPVVSYLYVGTQHKIATLKIDRRTDQVTRLADTSYAGAAPGWFGFDPLKNRLFVSDGLGASMTSMLFAPTSGALNYENSFPIVPAVIHFSFYPDVNNQYRFYVASYDASIAASYDVSATNLASSKLSEVDFPSGTLSHSITADRGRNLVFLSNLGESMIHIYDDSSGALNSLSSINVVNPRIVMYDAIFDRVYVSTQPSSGNSLVSIYNIVQSGGTYSLSLVASKMMGINGSDLKIDHSRGYLAATVRAPGNEGIWMYPIDSGGLFDPTRSDLFLPIRQTEARSLQISSDGRYYAVSCNSTSNTTADTIIYELAYDAMNAVTSSKIIATELIGGANMLANFWIDL